MCVFVFVPPVPQPAAAGVEPAYPSPAVHTQLWPLLLCTMPASMLGLSDNPHDNDPPTGELCGSVFWTAFNQVGLESQPTGWGWGRGAGGPLCRPYVPRSLVFPPLLSFPPPPAHHHPTTPPPRPALAVSPAQRFHRLFPDNETYVWEMERSIINVGLAALGQPGSGGQGPNGTGMCACVCVCLWRNGVSVAIAVCFCVGVV